MKLLPLSFLCVSLVLVACASQQSSDEGAAGVDLSVGHGDAAPPATSDPDASSSGPASSGDAGASTSSGATGTSATLSFNELADEMNVIAKTFETSAGCSLRVSRSGSGVDVTGDDATTGASVVVGASTGSSLSATGTTLSVDGAPDTRVRVLEVTGVGTIRMISTVDGMSILTVRERRGTLHGSFSCTVTAK